jgi:hypothetical protein
MQYIISFIFIKVLYFYLIMIYKYTKDRINENILIQPKLSSTLHKIGVIC